jgi:hypothetical protein
VTDEILDKITGANQVKAWFGKWPAFHDAEISAFRLAPSAVVTFKVYAWNMTSDVDANGYFRNEKYADVEFVLEGVSALSINDLTDVGVLFELDIEEEVTHLKLTLVSSYGVNGTISFAKGSVSLKPR